MKGILVQLVASLALSILHFLGAYSITWISYAGPLFVSENSPLGVVATKSQMNMIASIVILGCVLATSSTGQLPTLLGKKKTEILAGLICILAWALIITSRSIAQLIAARFLFGFGCGVHFIVAMNFINEFSQSFIRGSMASLPLFAFSFGCLVSYVTGWVCSYDVIGYINLTGAVLSTLLVSLLKESPVYLISRNKDKEALESLKFYRGTSKTTVAVLEELEYLKKQRDIPSYSEISTSDVVEKKDLEKEIKEDTKEMSSWKILVTSVPTKRATVVLISHMVLTSFMGAMAVQMYAGHFFMAAVPGISAHLCSVVLAVAIVIGNGLAILATDLVGRRVLLIGSCVICTVSLGILVTLIRWSWAPAWAVPLVMLTYSGAYQAGVNNIPLVQLSESFMPQVRGLASSIVMTSQGFSNFVLLSIFGMLIDNLGLDGTFFFFFILAVASTVVTFLTTKETKGIPLEEIKAMYERGYFYWQ